MQALANETHSSKTRSNSCKNYCHTRSNWVNSFRMMKDALEAYQFIPDGVWQLLNWQFKISLKTSFKSL